MYQIGLSVGAFLATEEMFQNYKKAGIAAIEVSHSINEHLEADDFPHFSQWAKEYGVQLWSYHLPFMDPKLKFDISEPNTADATVARFKELIDTKPLMFLNSVKSKAESQIFGYIPDGVVFTATSASR